MTDVWLGVTEFVCMYRLIYTLHKSELSFVSSIRILVATEYSEITLILVIKQRSLIKQNKIL